MGIINNFDDVNMIISGFSDYDIMNFVDTREFAIIKIEQNVIDSDWRKKFYPKYFVRRVFDRYTLQIDDEDETCGRTYLCIRDKLPTDISAAPGVSILYPSVKELVQMVSGKRLIYYTDFIEDGCVVESVVNKHLQRDLFHPRRKEEHSLYDKLFDVRIFLQRISDERIEESEFIKPVDVRNLDVNTKILSKLKEESNSFYNDAAVFEYAAVSDRLQAQYFLSKFHCNLNWDLHLVCILNFRISSFVLPGNISEKKRVYCPRTRSCATSETGRNICLTPFIWTRIFVSV